MNEWSTLFTHANGRSIHCNIKYTPRVDDDHWRKVNWRDPPRRDYERQRQAVAAYGNWIASVLVNDEHNPVEAHMVIDGYEKHADIVDAPEIQLKRAGFIEQALGLYKFNRGYLGAYSVYIDISHKNWGNVCAYYKDMNGDMFHIYENKGDRGREYSFIPGDACPVKTVVAIAIKIVQYRVGC